MIVSEETEREITDKGLAIYNDELRAELERNHMGEWVVIHVDTGDYAVGRRRWDAAQILHGRHGLDGRLLARRIGPPTESDFSLAERLNPTGSKSS